MVNGQVLIDREDTWLCVSEAHRRVAFAMGRVRAKMRALRNSEIERAAHTRADDVTKFASR